MTTPERFYPIGTPGEPWTAADKATWLAQRTIERSYAEEVRSKLEDLPDAFVVEQYGSLSIDPAMRASGYDVKFTLGAVMSGGSFTLSSAAALSTLPAELNTSTV